MRRIVLLSLSVVMLFTSVPVLAATDCSHPSRYLTYSELFWRPTGNGYNHSYVVSDGVYDVCSVTIEEYGCYKICTKCESIIGFERIRTKENHEIKSHN